VRSQSRGWYGWRSAALEDECIQEEEQLRQKSVSPFPLASIQHFISTRLKVLPYLWFQIPVCSFFSHLAINPAVKDDQHHDDIKTQTIFKGSVWRAIELLLRHRRVQGLALLK